ncbi:MAG TPA: methylmalonyl Co-A mutase-associated GTPase MeaB, partial [Ginsengibacter sp.]|nr:methylmalonyl Co-A mutase-associated GTPase MeaB [Ginsengibacter sp.]
GFDLILVETVGVGQSEVDIAALADITIVVLVPESGDSIQSMKAGLMEIADLFVVNKSDRPGADLFYNNLKKMLGPVYKKHEEMLPVFRTVASERKGTQRLYEYLKQVSVKELTDARKELLAQKAFTVLQEILMEQIDEQKFRSDFFHALKVGQDNIFRFAREYADKLKHL